MRLRRRYSIVLHAFQDFYNNFPYSFWSLLHSLRCHAFSVVWHCWRRRIRPPLAESLYNVSLAEVPRKVRLRWFRGCHYCSSNISLSPFHPNRLSISFCRKLLIFSPFWSAKCNMRSWWAHSIDRFQMSSSPASQSGTMWWTSILGRSSGLWKLLLQLQIMQSVPKVSPACFTQPLLRA